MNQGIRHFFQYWDNFKARIPGIAERLGVNVKRYRNTAQGFKNFTTDILARINSKKGVEIRKVNDKIIYFIKGAEKEKDGVVVIMKKGKIDTIMPSRYNSFQNME